MKDNASELLPLVDEEGQVVGKATRGECHSGSMLLHPVVHLHVFDPQGRLYVQHRPAWKDIQPDKWDTAVGGHIDWGENVEQALQREAREELGLTDYTPEFLCRYINQSDRERELVNVFRTTTEAVPTPSEELNGGQFLTREEILERIQAGNFFTPNFCSEWLRVFGNDAD